MNDQTRLIPADELEAACQRALLAAGAHQDIAGDVARALVSTSLRGIDSHGVALLPRILKRAEAGRCQLERPIKPVVQDAGKAVAVFEANLAPGQHSGMACARAAAEKAGKFGIGMAAVRNSTHFGAAAPYVAAVVEEGLAGFVGSNSTPSMAAFGATFPNLGNNPLGFGAPVEGGPDLIFDFSCGVMSFGGLAKLRAAGEPVPEDAFIKPTELPQDRPVYEIAGDLEWAALPFGGHKGASLAVMVEVLGGLLSNGNFGIKTEVMDGDTFRGPSHFVIAFDPQSFGIETMPALMAQYAAGIRQGRVSVRLPGDNAAAVAVERQRNGIPIGETLRREVRQLSDSLGVDCGRVNL
jgi:LDH2 family malate/lactate/ureidoglycolate dehydrogenase